MSPALRAISRFAAPAIAGALMTSACAREARPPEAASTARVEIVSPASGDSVTAPVTVELAAQGVEVVPANGLVEEGKGHHHLVLDVDLPPLDAPMPVGGGVFHMGTGAQTYVLDSLAPGPHRIIAVLAYGNHVPMTGIAMDTVRIEVRAAPPPASP
jgi:hypothetical protein